MKADLHTHSTASDGQYPPGELVRMAKNRGVGAMALTDHDTMDGLDEAVRAGTALGLRVVRGVELSAKEYHTFHILGYGFAPGPSPLADLCARMKRVRDERVGRILDYLAEEGVLLTEEEVSSMAGGAVIGRPHFAQAMVRRGYVSDSREAFDRYLDTEAYHQRVERNKPPVRECLDAIRASGGVPSLAHPYQIGLDDDALDALTGQLRDWGLEAIECYYPRHTPDQTAFYLRLAEKYGLHASGGSDFHGERVKPDIRLAAWELDCGWIPDRG